MWLGQSDGCSCYIFPKIFVVQKEDQEVWQVVLTAAVGMPNNFFYVQVCIQNQGMMKGDPSLKAVKHPKFGKILVATRNLPKGYYAAWWGKLCPKKQVPFKRMEWALETSKGMVDAIPYKGSQLKYCACPGRSRITTYSLQLQLLTFWLKDWVTGPSELPTIDFAPNSVAASDHFLTRMQWWRGLIDFWDDLNVHTWFSSKTWRDAIPKRHTKTQDVLLKSGEKLAAIVFQTLRPIPRNWQAAS